MPVSCRAHCDCQLFVKSSRAIVSCVLIAAMAMKYAHWRNIRLFRLWFALLHWFYRLHSGWLAAAFLELQVVPVYVDDLLRRYQLGPGSWLSFSSESCDDLLSILQRIAQCYFPQTGDLFAGQRSSAPSWQPYSCLHPSEQPVYIECAVPRGCSRFSNSISRKTKGFMTPNAVLCLIKISWYHRVLFRQ